MGMALNKSTDGGSTFQQVSVDIADYTSGGLICDSFYSLKDSQNNTYIFCLKLTATTSYKAKIIKILANGSKIITTIDVIGSASSVVNGKSVIFSLSRDESQIIAVMHYYLSGYKSKIYSIPTIFENGGTIMPSDFLGVTYSDTTTPSLTIYKDQYIWVASGTTVKIYNYDTKVELASTNINTWFTPTTSGSGDTVNSMILSSNGYDIYLVMYLTLPAGGSATVIGGLTWSGDGSIFTKIFEVDLTTDIKPKQLLIDRFGDLIILTNTGTASTLLKYSNTGTLIDTVNLSVAGILGVGRGAYCLQVYSKDDGTKCWVQFSNDLGAWKTAETTAQGQIFGAVSKIRDNGENTYGDDHGGDNNYSVRC